MAIDKIFNDGNVDGIADNIFNAVNNSVSEVKQMQQRKAAENAQMVVQSLKKIDTDIREKYDNVTTTLEKRIITIKDGRDGIDGKDGRDGKNGKDGRDGKDGKQGIQGLKGQDGIDGLDGVSVVNAHIDFDGSLIIDLSSGSAINVGEVVSSDLADKIQVISTMSTNGAVGIKDEGSSISTGVKNINFVGAAVTATNSGDDVTVNVSAGTGTVTSVAATVPTFLSVSGSPITTSGTLAISLSGTALPVANGGTGITSFGTGVATFLGTPSSANLAAAVTDETGSGALVFATSPTLVTPILGTPTSGTLTNATGLPISTGVSGLGTGVATALAVNVGTAGAPVVNGGALGTPSSGTVTNLTGTASININGTVGATTASSGAFTTLSATDVTTVQAGTAALPAITTTGDTNTGIFFPAADTIAFAEGGVEAARFDSAGNFGLGVTPSAWGSTWRALEGSFGQSWFYSNSATITGLVSNTYNNGTNWIYKTSNASSRYELADTHKWYIAGVGTAGNTISFTEAMTLTASGNLGIGTTSPATKLFVLDASKTSTTAFANIITSFRSNASGADSTIQFSDNVTHNCQVGLIGGSSGAFGVYTGGSERARIDSNGSLVVGGTTVVTNNGGITATTTSSGSVAATLGMRNAGTANGSGTTLVFRGVSNASAEHDYAYVAGVADDTTAKTGSIRFSTTAGSSPVERARIDSSGNLLVGTTSAQGGKLQVASSYIRSNDGQSSQGMGYVASDNAGNEWHFGRNTSNGYYYIVTQAGTGQYMVTGSSAWTAVSDERHKENLVPITDALSKVKTLRTVIGNLISDKTHIKPYLIAQDVQKVLPEAVDSSNPDKLGLAYTDVIPLLVAAIKEQTAIIESLKARLDAANL